MNVSVFNSLAAPQSFIVDSRHRKENMLDLKANATGNEFAHLALWLIESE